MESTPNVEQVFDALNTWIRQRPGLDFADYGGGRDGLRAYRSEIRDIGKDRKRALKALAEARRSSTQDYGLLMEAFKAAYSGRLEWKPEYLNTVDALAGKKPDPAHLSYTTGQYWPTEYRKAAASVLEMYVRALARRWSEEHPVTASSAFAFRNLGDVKRENEKRGGCWFEPATMRFFGTRFESELIGGQYFISSEKRPDSNEPRLYTVRRAEPDGSVETVGEFQGHQTWAAAFQAIRDIRQPIVTVEVQP